MKTVLNSTIVVFALLLISCNSSSKLVNDNIEFKNKPPFKIVESTYSSKILQQKDLKEITIYITINNSSILLDTVYFRNTSAKLIENQSSSAKNYKGVFTKSNTNPLLNLDSNPKNEFGNEVPAISQKIPFKLNDSEAIISYYYKNKLFYFKVDNVKEVKL